MREPGDVVVLGAVRSAIGRFGGSLAGLTASRMGSAVVGALLARTGVAPGDVDAVLMGNARQAGGGPNVARQISIGAGLPVTVPAWTLNMACGSGLKSVIDGARMIRCGEARVVVAGGVESMSRLPYYVEEARWGHRLGTIPLVDGMVRDGFLCPMAGEVMGETVEWLARRYGIPREAQDAFALESQRRAAAARDSGRFDREVVPIALDSGEIFDRDEHLRPDTDPGSLGRLPPVFRPGGTITAGNASGITDGAAAVVLASADWARERARASMGVIEAWSLAGVEPRAMGIGPVPALCSLLERTGTTIEDHDLYELNEAFAAQVLCVLADVPIPRDRLNVNGGAIALGHPIGATGCRILVTLLHEMQIRGSDRGLATLCISGGLGLAVSVRRPVPW